MINTERALLASFLWSNDLGFDTSQAFKLEPNAFTSDDRKLIASKINEVTESEDRFYSLLNLELERTSQLEWLEIAKYTPFSFSQAKFYHDRLMQEYKRKLVMGRIL